MLPLDIINLLFHALIAIGIQATALFVFCKLRGPFKELSILRKDIAALRQKIQEETIKRRRWVKKKILAQQKTKDCPRVSKSTLAVVKKVLTKQKDLEKKNMELEDRVLDIKRSLMDKPSIVMSSQLKRLESFCDNLSANVKTQDFKVDKLEEYCSNLNAGIQTQNSIAQQLGHRCHDLHSKLEKYKRNQKDLKEHTTKTHGEQHNCYRLAKNELVYVNKRVDDMLCSLEDRIGDVEFSLEEVRQDRIKKQRRNGSLFIRNPKSIINA